MAPNPVCSSPSKIVGVPSCVGGRAMLVGGLHHQHLSRAAIVENAKTTLIINSHLQTVDAQQKHN